MFQLLMIWQGLKKGHFHNCITRFFLQFCIEIEGQFWAIFRGNFERFLLFLLVVVRVVDTLHKGFAVVDFVGQSRLQKSLDI